MTGSLGSDRFHHSIGPHGLAYHPYINHSFHFNTPSCNGIYFDDSHPGSRRSVPHSFSTYPLPSKHSICEERNFHPRVKRSHTLPLEKAPLHAEKKEGFPFLNRVQPDQNYPEPNNPHRQDLYANNAMKNT